MYILYIILFILGTVPSCIYAKKDKLNSGIIVSIVIVSFIGLIAIVYSIYKLIRCKYRKDSTLDSDNESIITKYGAV